MARVILVALISFLTTSVFAQPITCPTGSDDCERVLLPIFTPPTKGAFGSEFRTTLSLWNRGTASLRIEGLAQPCQILCPPLPPIIDIPPRGAGDSSSSYSYTGEPGTLLYMRHADATNLAALLRVQDVSRAALTWGTEIPIVRDRDFFTDLLPLLNVPSDERFRLTLRVYGATSEPSAVRVRIVDTFSTGTTLSDFVLNLLPGHDIYHPAYAALSSFPTAPRVPNSPTTPTMRVEIEPVTPGQRFWAFLSVTNNETQHITIVTP